METVVGVEGNDEANLDHMAAVKTSPTLSSPTGIADPVIYTLVRVYCQYMYTHPCIYYLHVHTYVIVIH